MGLGLEEGCRHGVLWRGVTFSASGVPLVSPSTSSAFATQVYCWLVDRLGGGWTLGIVNAYRWCHPNQGNSPTGNVDRNVLGTVKLFVGISLTTLWTRHSSTHALYLLQFC